MNFFCSAESSNPAESHVFTCFFSEAVSHEIVSERLRKMGGFWARVCRAAVQELQGSKKHVLNGFPFEPQQIGET